MAAEPYKITISQGDRVLKEIVLPHYGEVKISTHDGTVRNIETTTKEKLS